MPVSIYPPPFKLLSIDRPETQFHIPISASTTQHLVNVERVHAHAQTEQVLAARLRNILVRTDMCSSQGFARQLFVLVRHQVAEEREFVHVGPDRTSLSVHEIFFSIPIYPSKGMVSAHLVTRDTGCISTWVKGQGLFLQSR